MRWIMSGLDQGLVSSLKLHPTTQTYRSLSRAVYIWPFYEVRKEGSWLKVPWNPSQLYLWSLRSLSVHGLPPQKFSHSFVKHQLPLAVVHCCLIHFSHLGNQERWDLKEGNQSWEEKVGREEKLYWNSRKAPNFRHKERLQGHFLWLFSS